MVSKIAIRFQKEMMKSIYLKISRVKNFINNQRLFNEKRSAKIITDGLNVQIKNPSLSFLLDNFRRYGHLKVTNKDNLTPIEIEDAIDLLKNYPIDFGNLPTFLSNVNSFDDTVKELTKIYCEGMGAEFFHLDDSVERQFFEEMFSNRSNSYVIDSSQKREYLRLMIMAEEFDRYLSKKFQSVKRYSGEGAETALVCLHEILASSARHQVDSVVLSMAHRARNNILTVMFDYPPVLFFRKMLGKSEFPQDIISATGDTFSHFFVSTNWCYDTLSLNVSLIPNPSHLEANIPVGAGKARSKMLFYKEGDYSQNESSKNGDNVLAVFVHGDASVCGQGIVTESLVMSNSPHFSIGGAIHIVINNRLGFTTDTPAGVRHVTDVAKIINCPVIHVDAYNVVEVARAAMLAIDFRQKFRKDVFINLIGYRRWGHNELDDPTITQPLMYSKIAASKSIPETFMETLIEEKCLDSVADVSEPIENWTRRLNEQLSIAADYDPQLMTFKKQWSEMRLLDGRVTSLGVYDTGVAVEQLQQLGGMSVFVPANFTVHPNVLKSHIARRHERMQSTETGSIDWATAEALSLGSLLAEGRHCRLSGQDVGRGTFSHRHLSLVDQRTNEPCVPLNLCPWPDSFAERGSLELANSILSEEAVLGFELGMALDNPDRLCVWEAQFGDFFNGAQILIDTYLGSAETKWLLQNGLVLLLPHGYDGAGPEHSSCRLERFLQLTDSSETGCDSDAVNLHIVNPTTPAQYFHVLRRQLVRPFRRPLVVVAPKGLLRSPVAVSSLCDLRKGTFFRHVLAHLGGGSDKAVTSLLLCSGKHFYTLKQHLETVVSPADRDRYALVRIEQLAPFPVTELREEMSRFANCTRFVWCQEEPRNMGAWSFVEPRVRNILGVGLEYVGRKELATPAVGIGELYKEEVALLLRSTFEK